MIVRRATAADADVIADFNARMALETEQLRLDPPTLAAGVRAALADDHKALYFVAEINGMVAGQLMITREWSDWRNADIWWIQSVYVHPDHRGRGIFRSLFQHVEREAIAAGVCVIRLYVHSTNTSARACYESLGMHSGHYQVMEKPLRGQKGE